MSVFDRKNEDGTSSHILYDLVDKNDPAITKIGKVSDFDRYLAEYTFRYNTKDLKDNQRFLMFLSNPFCKLTYNQLKR